METPQNTYGLTQRDMETLQCIFQNYPDVIEVVIFGSRAKGNYHPGSDIDLAIMNTHIPTATLRKIMSDLDESSLPYRVDLVNYHTITHNELREHIDRVGQPFYRVSTNL